LSIFLFFLLHMARALVPSHHPLSCNLLTLARPQTTLGSPWTPLSLLNKPRDEQPNSQTLRRAGKLHAHARGHTPLDLLPLPACPFLLLTSLTLRHAPAPPQRQQNDPRWPTSSHALHHWPMPPPRTLPAALLLLYKPPPTPLLSLTTLPLPPQNTSLRMLRPSALLRLAGESSTTVTTVDVAGQ
jgi:hypothetical protein